LKDGVSADNGETLRVSIGSSLEDTERRLILATLDRTQGQKRRAAGLLGISVKTLYNRLKAYGLRADGGPVRGDDVGPDPTT